MFDRCLLLFVIATDSAQFRVADEGVYIGSSLTLTQIGENLRVLCKERPTSQTYPFKAILNQLRWFSSNQIRNACSIGGNIITASPISDLNPVLQAAGATLTLTCYGGSPRVVPIRQFFKSYRVVDRLPSEVLLYVFVPFSKPYEILHSFKQARRREDDISIVTSGMRVRLALAESVVKTDKKKNKKSKNNTNNNNNSSNSSNSNNNEWIVQDATLSFGGMAATTICALKTQEFLVGKPWSETTLQAAYDMLSQVWLIFSNHHVVLQRSKP